MALTVKDVSDLTRILTRYPEWRAEMRRIVLSDELLSLPEIMRELAAAQARTEAALARTDQRIEELAAAQARTEAALARTDQRLEELAAAQARTEAAQARTEQRVGNLEEAVTNLIAAQARTEQRLEELAAAQARTEQRLEELTIRLDALTARVDALTARVDALTARVDALADDIRALTSAVNELAYAGRRMADRLDALLGDVLELRYREHAAGFFGRWLRRARAVAPMDVEDILEQRLSHEDMLDVLQVDLLVKGGWRGLAEAPEVWLAAEVSATLDEGDVARAWRRARLLQKAGYRAVPVVAGERITEGAAASARAQSVGVVQDGRGDLDNDLASWLT